MATNVLVLETIFELNLSLFQSDNNNKTKLIFVIRDHKEKRIPKHVIEDSVNRNIVRIWESISKPEMFKNSSVEDIFSIDFEYLRAFDIDSPENFYNDCSRFSEIFTNPNNPKSIINTGFHFRKSKNVPTSALHEYMKQIWESVKKQERLNIVSQKASLTNSLCEKRLEKIFSEFMDNIRSLSSDLGSGVVDDFGPTCSNKLKLALSNYDSEIFTNESELQDKESEVGKIKFNRRSQLEHKILEFIDHMFERQMRHASNLIVNLFEKSLQKEMPTDGTATAHFNAAVANADLIARTEFERILNDSKIGGIDFDLENLSKEYETQKIKISSDLRREQVRIFREEIESSLQNSFGRSIIVIAKKAETDLWERIHEKRVNAYDDSQVLMDKKIIWFWNG